MDFSVEQLREAVAAYDSKIHEAPITVGHPKDNAPAYGWIASLHYNDQTNEVEVEPAQVDAQFDELVQAGRFKKRSASWYLPDAPNNPTPGKLHLRHVAFLGAQPPAVKGLRDVSFADDEQGVVEFGDRWAWSSMTAILRNLREWLIDSKGPEAADKVIPNYLIADVERAGNETDTPAAAPVFSEEDPMKIEELQARVAALETENATLKNTQMPADFADREAGITARESDLAKREAAIARASVEARVDAAVKDGRLLPAQRKYSVDFAMSLADVAEAIEFGEGADAKKVSQREAYLLQIEKAPKVVDYSERAPAKEGVADGTEDVSKVVDKARALVNAANQDGKNISFTEAVAQASAELSGNA